MHNPYKSSRSTQKMKLLIPILRSVPQRTAVEAGRGLILHIAISGARSVSGATAATYKLFNCSPRLSGFVAVCFPVLHCLLYAFVTRAIYTGTNSTPRLRPILNTSTGSTELYFYKEHVFLGEIKLIPAFCL